MTANDTSPPFTDALSVLVFPALVPEPLGYVDRIMADGKVTVGEILTELFAPDAQVPPDAIGTLNLGPEGAALRMQHGSRSARVAWDRPFVVLVSHWPCDAACAEVSVSLRTRGADPQTPWLHFRTLWPIDALAADLPKKQDHAPYIPPKAFPQIWARLKHAALVHGDRLPEIIAAEVPEETLETLYSQAPAMTCIACGSSSVAPLGPEVYCCHICGYEGGNGYSEYLAQRKRLAYIGVDLEMRQALALEDLHSAVDDLMAAASYRWKVRADKNGKQLEEHLMEKNNAFRHKGLAFMKLKEASYKLPEQAEAFDEILALEPRVLNANKANFTRGLVVNLINTLDP